MVNGEYTFTTLVTPLGKKLLGQVTIKKDISGQGKQIFLSAINTNHLLNKKITHLNLDFKICDDDDSFSLGCFFWRTAGLEEREVRMRH